MMPPLRNVEAEQALLGALLFDNDALDRAPGLSADHFSEPVYGAAFAKLAQAIRAGRSADPITVGQAMAGDGRLSELGGDGHLVELMAHAPPARLVTEYARTLMDLALRRSLIDVCRQMQDRAAQDHDYPAEVIAADAERSLGEAVETASPVRRLLTGADAIEAALAHADQFGEAPEFPSGLIDLDRMLGGFQRGELTLIAGRPGMGKSVVGLGVAKTVATSGRGTIYFSLEMSEQSLGLRLACDLAFERGGSGDPAWGPTMSRVSQRRATPDELRALRNAQRLIGATPLRLDTRAGLTLSQIEQTTRKQFREWRGQGLEPGPIFIDHLGLVRPERDRRGSKYAETADVSRGLAEMAKRLDVPVIALCQLNRGVEGREDKRPQLSDLRQAGELEEDARMVILLHRPAYYLRSGPEGESFEKRMERNAEAARVAYVLNCTVAKNSNGPLGEVKCLVDVSRSAVRDWEA